jgi:methionyl-tRNA formyltransferase
MGTGPFALPMFQALLESSHEVLALVTRPDRPAHRREKSPINPMRQLAQQRGLEVFEPDSINSTEAQSWLRSKGADLLVVCDYGQILSQETLAQSRLGGINLHASLLPKYRGAAPINWAIYHGETDTGVTVIHMTVQLDAGPALVQLRTAIAADETAPDLESRLAQLGVGAALEAIDMLATGRQSVGMVQDPKLATKAPRLKKEDGSVDWCRSAIDIFNQVRAFQPWPKTFTFWHPRNGEAMRLILESVRPINPPDLTDAGLNLAAAGDVIAASSGDLMVACGTGAVRIDSLQPAGKRIMTADEFLLGHCLRVGDKLG